MATETTYLTLKLERPKMKPVEVECTYDYYSENIYEWLRSPSRTGRYAHEDQYIHAGVRRFQFLFSDENTAIEFKMRWSGKHP